MGYFTFSLGLENKKFHARPLLVDLTLFFINNRNILILGLSTFCEATWEHPKEVFVISHATFIIQPCL